MRRRISVLLASLLASAALAQVPTPPANDAEPLASLSDTPLLNVPRDEATQDRLAATALLAHGRMLQQRRDFAGALHRYQRAYRYDEQQRGLKEIVSLAIETGRNDQAARYAVLGGEKIRDPIVLRRLAVDSTNRRNWKLAAQLYELSLSPAGSEGARTAPQVLMRAELGRLYFLGDQFEKSHESFAQVREALARPDDYGLNESIQKIIVGDRKQTYSLMAGAALEAKKFDEALALFQEAYRDAPESDDAVLSTARVAERRGEHEVALKLFLPVLQKGNDTSPVAVEPLRRILATTTPVEKQEAQLEEYLTPVQAAHPENEPLRRHLAQCRLNQGKLAEAESLLMDAAVSKPSEELQFLLAKVRRAQKSADKYLATLADIAVASSIGEVEDEARAAAADADFAATLVQTALAVKTDSPAEKAAKGAAAFVALESKRWDDANTLWEASLSGDDVAKGKQLLLWGLRLTQADQYEAAMKTFQRVIDEKLAVADPAPAWFYLSGVASFAKEHERALEAARNAKAARPDDFRFIQREAWVLQHGKRYAEARQKYDDLLKRFDKSSDSSIRDDLRQVRLVLSTVCLELGDEAAAVERIEEVLDEFPEDIGAMNDLGYVWADRSVHLQRSLRMVQRAVTAEPENKAYRDSLGWVFYRLGRIPEAVAELEKAASGEDPGGVILDHLADALAKAGRPADAKSAWQRALESFRKEGNEKQALAVEQKIKQSQ